MQNPTSRFIFNNKNNRLHILTWKSEQPSAPSCLLLHGFSNNAHIWDPIAEALSAYFNVYALDFRGHGDSDWDEEHDYTSTDFIQDVHYCIETLSLNNFHLIGHSLGARIGALYLQHYNTPIRSFTAIDTGPDVNLNGSQKIRSDIDLIPSTFKHPDEYLEIIKNIYLFSSPDAIQQLVEHDLKLTSSGKWQLKFDKHVTQAIWAAPLTADDLWSAFGSVQQPFLIMRGKISAILKQATADKMLAHIPQAELDVIPRAGHAVMTDNPESTIQSLLSFLRKN